MFKAYYNKYSLSAEDSKQAAYELASLLPDTCNVYYDAACNYYIWDNWKWFSVKDADYVTELPELIIDTEFIPVETRELKTVWMRRFAVTIGNRNIVPIYNFETNTIKLLGINYEDVGGILRVNDRGAMRLFAYGVRGSEFHFEEL